MYRKVFALAIILLLTTAAAGCGPPAIHAEGSSDLAASQTDPVETTVAQILADPAGDQMVILRGQIVERVEDNEFLLDDGTGTIVLCGGPPWHHQVALEAGQEVAVTGQVSLGQAGDPPEIDLFSYEAGGEVTVIREGGGPPPWAGQGRGEEKDREGQGDHGPPPWAGQEDLPDPVETTVAQILADPAGDQMVILRGQIVEHVEGNEFLLDDGTGTIVLCGGPPWHDQVALEAGQEVAVTGQVSLGQAGDPPEIDLFSYEAGGEVTVIREGGGPPPWAGQGRGEEKGGKD